MASIVKIEIIPLANPEAKPMDLDGTTETVIVRILDENGLSGIGECDAPAHVVKAFLEMPTQHLWCSNASELLIGADPVETTALWERLYEGTIFPGRRGLGIHALSAVDIALHDLAGKQLGLPVYKLLGGAQREFIRPLLYDLSRYATRPINQGIDDNHRETIRYSSVNWFRCC